MDSLSVPFLTRKMLAFEGGVAFSLKITTQSVSASPLTIRGLTREGVFTFLHIPTNNSVIATEVFRVPDIPIMVSVTDKDGTLGQGDTYVTLDLVANGDVLYNLFAGLVYRQKSLSWPGQQAVDMIPGAGKVATKQSTDPAAGVELSLTVPAGQIWKFISAQMSLITDGTVASRRVHLAFDYFTGKSLNMFCDYDQVASETIQYSCSSALSPLDTKDSGDAIINTPANIILIPGDIIKTRTTNIQGGDNYGVMDVIVEQFFTPV